jgi:hypothetical protein
MPGRSGQGGRSSRGRARRPRHCAASSGNRRPGLLLPAQAGPSQASAGPAPRHRAPSAPPLPPPHPTHPHMHARTHTPGPASHGRQVHHAPALLQLLLHHLARVVLRLQQERSCHGPVVRRRQLRVQRAGVGGGGHMQSRQRARQERKAVGCWQWRRARWRKQGRTWRGSAGGGGGGGGGGASSRRSSRRSSRSSRCSSSGGSSSSSSSSSSGGSGSSR